MKMSRPFGHFSEVPSFSFISCTKRRLTYCRYKKFQRLFHEIITTWIHPYLLKEIMIFIDPVVSHASHRFTSEKRCMFTFFFIIKISFGRCILRSYLCSDFFFINIFGVKSFFSSLHFSVTWRIAVIIDDSLPPFPFTITNFLKPSYTSWSMTS